MSGGSHRFGDGSRERDNVMARRSFDLIDACDIEARLLSEQRGIGGGTSSQASQLFRRRQFHFKPLLKFVLIAPDGAHFRACITGNQYVKTSVCIFCSAITRRGEMPRRNSDSSAPCRTIAG